MVAIPKSIRPVLALLERAKECGQNKISREAIEFAICRSAGLDRRTINNRIRLLTNSKILKLNGSEDEYIIDFERLDLFIGDYLGGLFLTTEAEALRRRRTYLRGLKIARVDYKEDIDKLKRLDEEIKRIENELPKEKDEEQQEAESYLEQIHFAEKQTQEATAK